MPRIPEEDLTRIKNEIDLAALVRAKGIELKPHGADLIGRCPFHNDKTPSLIVTPSKGLWHCMGACQIGGSVIDWTMKVHGVSFRHAVELLRDGKASTLLPPDKAIKSATAPILPLPLSPAVEDKILLNQVTAYYHKTLLEDPLAYTAREYLSKRGLMHVEAIKTFQIGYANRTLGLRLPDKNREAGAAIRGRLESLGVFRKESGHEHLAGSLVVPILDEYGNTQGLYGRKVVQNLRPGTPKHLYLPGPHQGIFNPACLKHTGQNGQKEIILCESLLDALSFWVHGFRNVTASYGVEGFTEEMLTAFITHGVKRLYIAYDRDEAGDKAAKKLSHQLIAEGIETLRILFPHGMDANQYIQKVKPAEHALKVLIHGALWLGKGGHSPVLIKTNKSFSSLVDIESKAEVATTQMPSGEIVDTQTGEVLDAEPETLPEIECLPLAASVAAPFAEQIKTPEGLPYTLQGEDVHISLGDRVYRVRGLYKNNSFEIMKVNVRVTAGERYYLDSFDLYSAKGREAFVNHASFEIKYQAEVIKRDIGRVLLLLESLQEERIHESLKPKDKAAYQMTKEEEEVALAYLRNPELINNIVQDLTACGYVGEETNKLTGYLAAVSRKLPEPLSLLIQSSSAAGKSTLMESILALLPAEDKTQYSALTGQALFYMDGSDLKHKVLAIAEEGGMEKAAYALKMLMTEKKLRIASTGKDPQTGKLITQTYEVEGPTAIFYTTTNAEVDPELQNRCVVLCVDEEREQTSAILALQRQSQTLEGQRTHKRKDGIHKRHQNAQRLLKPLCIVNPYAPFLTFESGRSRLRRDQRKYLNLINAITLLHQYQRTLKRDSEAGDYIEVTLPDIALANRLCAEVLGRTLDELAPQTRKLLKLLTTLVLSIAKEKAMEWPQIRLSRFDIRASIGWGDTALKVHLNRLSEMGYLLVHRASRGLTYEYELLYRGEGENGGKFLLGLIDMQTLKKKINAYNYDKNRSGQNTLQSGSGQPLVGARSEDENELLTNNDKALEEGNMQNLENTYREEKKSESYLLPHHNGHRASSLVALS